MKGKIVRISGPLVVARGIDPAMFNVVRVGEEELLGEVIKIEGELSYIQVYEDTSGLSPGEPVLDTGMPLTAVLAPGLLSSIYDGIQRPLEVLKEKGDFILRGISAPAVDEKKSWEFIPLVKKGELVEPGKKLGFVKEFSFKHFILVPPGVRGKVDEIYEGNFRVNETVAVIGGREVKMLQRWPIRKQRPFSEKLDPKVPLITGTRVIDFLFPVAKGGTAAIPGGFGTGKTVTQQTLAKYSDADIVIYVGCGERGNEMAEVLEEFPELKDPRSNRPLMERTVLIANTSNMPVAAREASIYLGATIGEYFRDMGYDVALMADSTSRWAEALREISSRLGEMPGEEGYPAYLASRIAAFYERAGRVRTLGGYEGSLTLIGAVSPPGGDFSEPVTQNTLRVVKVFWALDKSLASRRHFPAINWNLSYSLYATQVSEWWRLNVSSDYEELRNWALEILQVEKDLLEIVQLVGPDALPEREKLLLLVGRMIREDFLQQNAFTEDAYCEPKKQVEMLRIIRKFKDFAFKLLEEGKSYEEIRRHEAIMLIARLKNYFGKEFDEKVREIEKMLVM